MNGQPQNGQGALVALRRPEYMAPATTAAPPNQLAPQTGMVVDQNSVLAAVRRRWLVAGILGMLGGLLGAACAWLLIPVSYSTHAELRIRAATYVPGGKSSVGVSEKGDVFRQTLTRVVQSQMVLRGVLRRSEIQKLQTIREQGEQVEQLAFLEKSLKISAPGQEFISVSMSGSNPQELERIVNAVVDVFTKEVDQRDKTERAKVVESIDKAKQEVRTKLTDWQRAKERLVKKIGSENEAGRQVQMEAKEQFYAAIRKSLTTAKIEKSKILAELSLRESENKSDPQDLSEQIVNLALDRRPEVQAALAHVELERQNLARLERASNSQSRLETAVQAVKVAEGKLNELRDSLREPVIADLKRNIDQLTTQGSAQLRRQVQLLDVEIELYEKQLVHEDESRTNNLTWTFELSGLNKSIEQFELMFNRLQDEGEHARFSIDSQPRVERFRDAPIPAAPDIGKKVVATLGSGGGLFGLIVVGILLLDLRTRRINSLDDIVSGLRLPILGSLPLIPAARSQSAGAELSGGTQPWQGALIESVDSARVMLLRRASLENAKVVMISSAITSEGKTTMSCHMATSLARAGYRTVVIDADLRRPTVHRVFNVASEPGLCEAITQPIDPSTVIQPTSQEGLFVIASGVLTGDALRQLAQDGMTHLMDRLRAEFDFVVVDTSPLMPVTDGLLIAQYVDGVILSVRRDVSQFSKVASACQKLQMMGAPIWGAVVIGVDQSLSGYRYSYGYGYGYGAKASRAADVSPVEPDPAEGGGA